MRALVQRRQELYEPAINSRAEYKNMLVLGHYRNKIVHLFFKEGIFACALYALMEKQEQAATAANGAKDAAAAAAASSNSSAATPLRPDFSTGGLGAFPAPVAHVGISRAALLSEARFLFNLLQREFITSAEMPDRIDSDKVRSATLAAFAADACTHNTVVCCARAYLLVTVRMLTRARCFEGICFPDVRCRSLSR